MSSQQQHPERFKNILTAIIVIVVLAVLAVIISALIMKDSVVIPGFSQEEKASILERLSEKDNSAEVSLENRTRFIEEVNAN